MFRVLKLLSGCFQQVSDNYRGNRSKLISDVVLVSLLLTLNKFHKFFLVFPMLILKEKLPVGLKRKYLFKVKNGDRRRMATASGKTFLY